MSQVEVFSKEQFEAALPNDSDDNPLWSEIGLVQGEYEYEIRVKLKDGRPTNKRICIRSSVEASGFSSGQGQNSIRAWVEYWYPVRDCWQPLGKGDTTFRTHRTGDWRGRLIDKLRKLYKFARADSRGRAWTKELPPTSRERQSNGDEIQDMDSQSPPESVFDFLSNRPDDEGGAPEPAPRDQTEQPAPSGDNPGVFDFLGESVDLSAATADPGPANTDAGEIPEASDSPVQSLRVPNAQQRLAIEFDHIRPLRILAPPGSGKTFVLEHRYGYLLSQGVSPTNIIAVTFSRAMAQELLARIVAANPGLEGTDAERNITTIHAICFRILRAEGDRRVVPGRDSPVKNWQVKKALQEIIALYWVIPEYRPGWREVLSFIGAAKANCLDTDSDMQLFGGVRDRWGRLVERELHLARRDFDVWMEENRVILFVDMLYDVERNLREDPSFRRKWQNLIEYVIIDEGQDTSAQAMRILTTLAKPQDNVTIVGDTDQLLYRFAGATPEANLYEGFEAAYPDGGLIFLETNYRSTQRIIRACSNLIHHNYNRVCPNCKGVGILASPGDMVPPEDDPDLPVTAATILKECVGEDVKVQVASEVKCDVCRGRGELSGVYENKYLKKVSWRDSAPEGNTLTFSMHADPIYEAAEVARAISASIDLGRDPGDFFIGVRTRAQTGYLEGPLVALGIPYINLVGSSFFGMKHIADVLGYLRLAYDKSDHEAFKRVFNIASADFVHPWGQERGNYCHHRYLGKAFLQACYDGATSQSQYKWIHRAADRRSSWRHGVADLSQFVDRVTDVLATEPLNIVLDFIIAECYEPYLKAEEGIIGGDASEDGKLDDFKTLKDVAKQFASASDFIQYTEEAKKAAESAKTGNWDGHVVLSTIHRLKGQERPIVFGVGFCEMLLPHRYSLEPREIKGALPVGSQGRIEDERDIAFVLVSRAKEECHLSAPLSYRGNDMIPSRFLYEMGLR